MCISPPRELLDASLRLGPGKRTALALGLSEVRAQPVKQRGPDHSLGGKKSGFRIRVEIDHVDSEKERSLPREALVRRLGAHGSPESVVH